MKLKLATIVIALSLGLAGTASAQTATVCNCNPATQSCQVYVSGYGGDAFSITLTWAWLQWWMANASFLDIAFAL